MNRNYNKSSFLLPRRYSELPPLEPESDDDDKVDKLNCAIVSDSFLMSPENTKNEVEQAKDMLNTKISSESSSNNVPVPEKNLFSYRAIKTSSRQLNFPKNTILKDKPLTPYNVSTLLDQLSNNCKKNDTDIPDFAQNINGLQKNEYVYKSKDNIPSQQCIYQTSNKPLTVVNSNQVNKTNLIDSKLLNTANKKNHTTDYGNNKEQEPQFKTVDDKFMTPQVKYSAQSSRSRSNLKSHACDINSQKILFSTPVSMSRPLSSFHNDDILSNTINEETSKLKCSPIQECNNEKKAVILSEQVNEINSQDKIIGINGKKYALLKKIGCGGSSSVYLSKELNTQFEYALKIVDLCGDSAVVEGYLNEVKLLAKLQGNSNVVTLYDYYHQPSESILYMVMEKGDCDLHKILQTHSENLPLYLLISYWYQMLQAVNYIHQHGVIHSDLKPANFLMINDRLKLIDFGIASNISTDSTSIIKYAQAGTFNYISPEALIDTSNENSPTSRENQPKIKISTKSDVWSLGCIFYLFLYRKTPFAHIKNAYTKITTITNPKTEIDYPALPNYYPPMLLEMVQNCLKHNPKKRSTVSDLLKYPFNKIINLN